MKAPESDIQSVCQNACIDIVGDAATALRAKRLTVRLARLARSQVVSAEDAVFADLNHLVFSVVEDALPLCLLQGTMLTLHQDPRVPAVPILVEPIEDALAAALDICLEDHAGLLEVRTGIQGNRAVASFERHVNSAPTTIGEGWIDIEEAWSITRVELLVGTRATRALGGRMRFQRRADDLRVSLELPIADHAYWSFNTTNRKPVKDSSRLFHLELPGTESYPNLTTTQRVFA